jgi:hypothetical protein
MKPLTRHTSFVWHGLAVSVVCAALAACGSTSTITTTRSSAAAGTSPGAPGGGGAPGGSSGQTYTATGAYTLSGGSVTFSNRTFTASGADESGVLVKNSGVLSLKNSTIRTTGNSKSADQSSFYGLNAGLLAESGGKATLTGTSVHTTGSGANDVFAYGSGASVAMTGGVLTATGGGGHGAMASGGGALKLTDVSISTAGASSAAVATDRGGGTVTVRGGTMRTAGFKSPGIYSTGRITVERANMTATAAEGAVVEGGNWVTVIDSTLNASTKGGHGVMLYNSMSGDAAVGTGHYTMTGGSLTAPAGPAFYVTNTKAVITVGRDAKINASSHVLLRSDSAGTGSGNTGAGRTLFTAIGETLSGNLITGGTGTITAALRNRTTLTATINAAALTIDSTSNWIVTGNSTLTSLSDPSGISGTSIKNIRGNGHTVTYNPGFAANAKLGGKTYGLAGGGVLKPT